MKIRPASLLACGLLWLQQATAADAGPPVLFLYSAETDAPMAAEGGAETMRVTEQGEHVVSNVHRPSLTVREERGS